MSTSLHETEVHCNVIKEGGETKTISGMRHPRKLMNALKGQESQYVLG